MPLCCHIMRHQRRVIAAHRTWCVEQRSQQILPDIPNSCCVLLQAVHDETDMLAVQLQQLCPHDLGRVVIACNADSAAGAANRLPVPGRRSRQAAPGQREITLPERRSQYSPRSSPGSVQTIPSLPFASAREFPGNRKGVDLRKPLQRVIPILRDSICESRPFALRDSVWLRRWWLDMSV